jgi:endoglucanase
MSECRSVSMPTELISRAGGGPRCQPLPQFILRPLLVSALKIAVAITCVVAVHGRASSAAEPVTVPYHVAVKGNRIVDSTGSPFLIKGLIVRPVIATAPYVPKEAVEHFGKAELGAAKRWGANTIRILTSQPGLDPQDPIYDPQYVQRVAEVAQEILDEGFILVIGVNYEKSTGAPVLHCLPTAATKRAWQTLLTLSFAHPQYQHRVILELFNEPVMSGHGDADWLVWQRGAGAGTYAAYRKCAADDTVVGMNELIAELRSAGLKNVIVADGLGWAHYLDPRYPLTDPLGQLAYAAHPFLQNWRDFTLTGDPIRDRTVLEKAFGGMLVHGPVIATAIGGGGQSGPNCHPNAPTVMPFVFDFLTEHGIGAIGWAFDLPPNTLTTDWNWTPSSYLGFRCPSGGVHGQGGMGELLQAWFQGRELPRPDEPGSEIEPAAKHKKHKKNGGGVH